MAKRPDRVHCVRIVHLSSAHRADDIRIFQKECRSLARAGHQVEFIVPARRADRVDGVSIVPLARRSGRAARMMLSTIDVGQAALKRNAEVYHFHDPELIPVGLFLRALGKRVVYDVHEDVPRSLLHRSWLPRLLRRPVAMAAEVGEWFAARLFTGIAAATPVIARRFPPDRTVLVQNFPVLAELILGGERLPAARRSIVYLGSVSATRGAREMVEAIAKVRFRDVRLVIAGEMSPPSLLSDLERLPGWERVDYLGWQSRSGVRDILSQALAGIVVLQATKAYVVSQPIKLFEYMAAGIPIIASDFPLWRQWLVGHECGLFVRPDDIDAIAAAIEWIMEHPDAAARMGQNGRSIVLETFNWEVEEKRLLAFYQRLAAPAATR
jgi:glycosyltransferase involved in cell wall biosynthesis